MSNSVLCHGCGELVEVPPEHARRKLRCPHCGTYCDVAAQAARTQAPRADVKGSVEEDAFAVLQAADEPEAAERVTESSDFDVTDAVAEAPIGSEAEDESDETYNLVESEERPCPGCREMITKKARVCTACGYVFKTGQKLRTQLPSFSKRWEPLLPLQKRRALFALGITATLVLGVGGAISQGDWLLFLGPWLGLACLLAFLLGSFLRVELQRNEKGTVKLRRTWVICFVERPVQKIRLRDYEGLHESSAPKTGIAEVCVLIFLLPTIVLAVAWWWHGMRGLCYQVALTRDHGYPACILYQGGSEEMMREIATSIRESTDLR